MDKAPRLMLINGERVVMIQSQDQITIKIGRNATICAAAKIVRGIGLLSRKNYALRWKNGLRITAHGRATT